MQQTILSESLIKRDTCSTERKPENNNVTVLPVFPRSRSLAQHPGYIQVEALRRYAEMTDTPDPFFARHDAIAGATTLIQGETFVNFASYNYLGLNGHPRVSQAAKEAIERIRYISIKESLDGTAKRTPVRSYQCTNCKGFHLTSRNEVSIAA